MSDSKISDLTEIDALTSSDSIVVVDASAGTNKKSLLSKLLTLVSGGIAALGTGVLKSNGSALSTGAVNLASGEVSGVLPNANIASTFSGKTIDAAANTLSNIGNTHISDSAGISGSKLQAASGANAGTMSSANFTKLANMQPQATISIPAMDIDWSAGQTFSKTLAAGANTFTFANNADRMGIQVAVTADAGGSTLAWPAGIYWLDDTVPDPPAASKTALYSLVQIGSVIFGTGGAFGP